MLVSLVTQLSNIKNSMHKNKHSFFVEIMIKKNNKSIKELNVTSRTKFLGFLFNRKTQTNFVLKRRSNLTRYCHLFHVGEGSDCVSDNKKVSQQDRYKYEMICNCQ
jgi:hypothetical protein